MLSAALLSGCGGSSASTKKQVVAQADAICSAALGKARGLDSGDASYYSQLAKIVRDESKKLGELPRPAADRAELELFIRSVDKAGLVYGNLATAERDGNQDEIGRLTAELAASPSATYAAAYGLRECAGTAGTLVSR